MMTPTKPLCQSKMCLKIYHQYLGKTNSTICSESGQISHVPYNIFPKNLFQNFIC